MKLDGVLRSVFGLAELRSGQREAIEAFFVGRDVLVVLATGGGKSLCYQLPAVTLARTGRGPTLVVSPLVSLMDDQVAYLRSRGVRAFALHSGISYAEQRRALRELSTTELVYASPERLLKPSFAKLITQQVIARAVVDEAHCISEWGHDFRPEYRALSWLKHALRVPVMAVTATATPRVREDIVESLALESPVIVTQPSLRPNLRFHVTLAQGDKSRTAWAIELLTREGFHARKVSGKAVVYATTRKRAEAVQRALRKAGIRAGYYHAGRKTSARTRAHALFERGATPVLVATSAYGMGIDLPDIRLVLHVDAPGSLEAYVQQAGRAGRDGGEAHCHLAYADSDELTHKRLWGPTPRAGAVDGFRALRHYALASECRALMIARHFGEADAVPCGACDACTAPDAVNEAARTFAETKRARARARKEQARAERAVELDEAKLGLVVAFVDALPKPLGRRLVVKGLRGSRAREVVKKKLLLNPHFGAMREVPESAIFRAIDELLERGLLVPKGKKYPTLWVQGKAVRPRAKVQSARPKPHTLEQALRRFRRNEAKRRRIKPYQVFQDRSLLALCEQRPTNEDELRSVWGMGEARVEKYGSELLALVRNHS